MGTFDHLIISMGVHLSKIHGRDNVVVLSADDRLTDILHKCCTGISKRTQRKLHLEGAEKLTGVPFAPNTFPRGINLKTATKADLREVFGAWPLDVGTVRGVYRWARV